MVLEELEGEWVSPPEGGGLPVPDEEFIRNIRTNCKLELPNLKHEPENDKIMVMVCGGPSAKLYLEEIRQKSEDDRYHIFCSNKTHDWLISNGIIPYADFIIDPKESKIEDVRNPQPDVHYYIGAQCHPDVFKALEGYKVTRILTYCGISVNGGPKDTDIINAFFDSNEFTPLEGGTMAGLRAMPMANLLGYLKVEFYGFDSCFFEKDEKGNPVYYSYEKKRHENILEAQTDDGRIFLTSPVFASQARQFIKWKHRLAWIDFIIHGDSLTAHINKLDEEKIKPKHNMLISDYMLAMNKELHKSDKYFGAAFSASHAGAVCVLIGQLIKKYDGEITMLDYGCGKSILKDVIPPITGLTIKVYDPCIDEYSARPEPADIVVCTDVLEHIEPDCLDNVLDDLKNLTKKILYVQVCVDAAKKNYSDGQNAHLIQKDFTWWYPKFRKRFHIVETKETNDRKHKHFSCVLQAQEVR